jgi:DNA-binding SARP family transcriptional activator
VETQVHAGGAQAGERPQALLKLYLLGRFEVVRDDAPIPDHAWRRRRPADLLKLVALSPGRTVGREQAIDVLWPDKDPASGANNLHRALYDLRQILGGRWVDIDRGQLRMRADVWIDVDAFERAAAQGGREGWTQAVALYRGDLAPEDLDSPWLQERRVLLRARFAEAAFPLARAAAQDGEAQLAIPLLRRVLEVQPAAEEAHRLLMRLLAESGRRAEALRQFDACEVALRAAALGPSDEVRALRAAIQRGEIGPTARRATLDGARRAARRLLGTIDPAAVRGRGPLLLLVESLVEQGSGALVLLGEPGVGKTRLAVEGARIAQARGAAIACGIGGTRPGVPYALFADVFREEARANPAVSDPFAAAPPDGIAAEGVRRALFERADRALVALADGRPLYLLLDDVHLADESSLNLVHFFARRAAELRLMIVATCSEEAVRAGTPIQTALAHLDCGRLARGVRVPRLGLAGTREQIADLLGANPPEDTVVRIYRATDGAPLLVEEVVRAQREAGQEIVTASPPAAIRARVARLGGRADALLAAAAVAGVRFDFELARLVSGLTAHEAVSALDSSLDARLVDEDGDGYRFHHALVRDAIYGGLAPERRTALHAAVADATETAAGAQEPPSEVIALHRRRARQDGRAIRHLVAAGHRAAARAGLREAFAFYAEALELASRPPVADAAGRLELLDAIGRVQLGLGELGGAARAFREAARLVGANGAIPDPPVRARSHRLAALALALGGRLRAAYAEIDEGVAAAAAGGGEGLAPLLHLRAQLLWHDARDVEALAAAEACASEADRAGDDDLSARGRDMAALARAMAGAPLEAPEDGSGRAGRALQDAAPEHPVDVHLVLWARDLLGRDCADVGRAAALHSERALLRGEPDSVAVGRSGEGTVAVAAGQLDVAEAALRDALAGHRASASALGEALALERLAALLTMRGRLDEARAAIDEGIVVAERSALRRHALTLLHATEARNRLAAGAPHAAEDAVREASETAARHGDCATCDAALRPEAVRTHLARGRVAEADAEASQLEAIARERGGGVFEAIARLARARVLEAQGRLDDALADAAAARAAFVAAGHRYEAARCARLEARLRGPGAGVAVDLRALAPLVTVEADV